VSRTKKNPLRPLTSSERRSLVADFPRLWREPATTQRERKRMVRLLLEDVTLLKADEVVAKVRFRGGAIQEIRLPLPLSAPELRKTHPTVVAEINRLLDHHTDAEIADILNARGLRPGVADRFSLTIIYQLRMKYRLEDRFSRLRRQGLLTLDEMAAASRLHRETVKDRAAKGRLVSYICHSQSPPDTPVRHRTTQDECPGVNRMKVGGLSVELATEVIPRWPDVRLLTIVGPPGAGKTRLALMTAESLADTDWMLVGLK
jgi:hypothetical protein